MNPKDEVKFEDIKKLVNVSLEKFYKNDRDLIEMSNEEDMISEQCMVFHIGSYMKNMNMCMVQDDKGNVLALDKVNDSYTGTTFPGGHVEQNEIFQKSIIREVWEETGLTIESPKLCGLYHWHEDGVHSVIMLYKAEKFIGELKSSEEGQVYWIPLEELKTRELATGMKYVLQILGADQVNECYMHLESEGYVGDLY